MKKQTTALLLGSLLIATSDAIEQNKEEITQLTKNEASDLQCQILSNSPFENFQNKNFTPIVDKDLIKKHILGSSKEYKQALDLLWEVHSIPQVALYIDLVFTHLKGFQIVIYPAEELIEKTHHYAAYFSTSRTMCLPDKFPQAKKFLYKNAIMHELRHAAMQTMLEKILNSKTRSTECFFPNNEQEKAAVLVKLEQGDKKVEELKELLNLEVRLNLAKNSNKKLKITKDQKKALAELKNLRTLTQLEYDEHYQTIYNWEISNEEIKQVSKLTKKEFEMGETFNFDEYRSSSFGDLQIQQIVEISERNSKSITFIFRDPLQAIAYQVPLQREHVKNSKNYLPGAYLFEREAYLHGAFPQKIIEYFYSDLYTYTDNLINTAFNLPSAYEKPLFLDYVDLTELAVIEMLEILSNPELFVADYADTFILWANYAIEEKGKVEEAKIGLNTLIQKGYHVGEANLELGRIAFSEKDYKAAETYYKRAYKHDINFTNEDEINYSFAQEKMGKLKSAFKWFKKASCPRKDLFEPEENLEFSASNTENNKLFSSL